LIEAASLCDFVYICSYLFTHCMVKATGEVWHRLWWSVIHCCNSPASVLKVMT